MKGKFFAIGVGCGDPELLTLKAVRAIKDCDVIALPMKKIGENAFSYEIVKRAIPEIIKKEKVNIFMPMIKNCDELEKIHIDGSKIIECLLNKGKNVAFLTIGDVCIYSTAIYIYKKIKDDGYDCEIISGIPSFCSAAAQIGISLCEGEDKLHIIPSFNIDTEAEINNHDGNFVFMKSAKKINSVIEDVHNNKLIKTAYLAENVALVNEKIVDIKLKKVKDTGYFSVIIAKKSEEV